jgi:tetratricopeptide (TPR) repeat protein
VWRIAAAAALVLTALGAFLLLPNGQTAEAYSVVRRLDRVEVLKGPGGEFRRDGRKLVEALALFSAERWDEAAQAFREVGSADGDFYRIASLSRGRRIEEAVRETQRFFASNPGYAAADLVLYWHAHHLRELGRGEESKAALQALIVEHPKSELVALAQSQLADDWHEFQKAWSVRDRVAARAALERLIRLRPDAPAVKGGDADFYLIGCVDEATAIALADEFVRRFPSHSGCDYVLYFKAVYLGRAGRKSEALETCRSVLAAYPKSGMAPHVRALMEGLK